MAVFTVGKAHVSDTPLIRVDAGLRAGTHHFKLVVMNDQGVESLPALITVTVIPRIGPVAIAAPTPTRIRRKRSGPGRIGG